MKSKSVSKTVSMFVSIFVFSTAALVSGACAHKVTVPEAAIAAESTPAPQNTSAAKTQIKYFYVETPSTVSAMTTAPFERADVEPRSFWSKVLNVFWPLLTMIVTGLVFILVLLVEHRVLNKQLTRRADLKARLQGI